MNKKLSIFILLFVSLMLIAPVAAIVSVTNDYYTIYIDDGGQGEFTVGTGTMHPYPNTNVLYGGTGYPGTSWFEINFYDLSDIATLFDLQSYYQGVAIDTNSMTETWDIGDSFFSPSTGNFVIARTLTAHGDTYASSYVEIETTFTNNLTSTINFGFWDMWDLMIAGSDDAIMRTIGPQIMWTGNFQGWYPPMFSAMEITDVAPPLNTFSIYIPFEGVDFTPTVPDNFIYGDWSPVGHWGYVPSGGYSDSGIAFVYGASESSPISLATGESTTIYQYISTNAEAFNINVPSDNNVSPVSFLPLYRVKLEQAIEMWECIISQLPEEISEENALLIESVQSFMSGAITLTNPIYANGQLSKAIDQMLLIQEAFDIDCVK